MLTFNYSLEQIGLIAQRILPHLQHKVVLLQGEMGAGKTTLVAALVKALGANQPVNSPTFSIVNEYAVGESKIFHFDFYRINHLAEAVEIGTEEYFYSSNWCFVEWAERIEVLLPNEVSVINIKNAGLTQRIINIENKIINTL